MAESIRGAPPRKPPWLKIRLSTNEAFHDVRSALSEGALHTVCEEARCPNRHECWGAGTATFLILGQTCAKACGFCAVASGRPAPLDPDEPGRVAAAVARLRLRYVVLTAVDRDDLPDFGAGAFAETVRRVRERSPSTDVEVLIGDLDGREELLRLVLGAGPLVIGHNVEVVRRLYPEIRFRHTYERSLGVLRAAARWKGEGRFVKSGFMVGLGEEEEEVDELLRDLRGAGVEAVTIGQYLQPTAKHRDVVRYIPPASFERWKVRALDLGFLHVEAGPLVRSSYRAERIAGKIDRADAAAGA